MDTTIELTNRMIAEAKAHVDGWRVEQHGAREWWIFNPAGNVARTGMGEETHCWWWIADQYPTTYLFNTDTALTLIAGLPLSLSSAPMFTWGNGFIWRAEIPYKPYDFLGYANDAPLAICRAFMAWYQATQEGRDG